MLRLIEEGVTILLAEQNTNMALQYAEYAYILENGRVVMEGTAESMRDNEDVKEFYLGISGEGRQSFKDVKQYRRRKDGYNIYMTKNKFFDDLETRSVDKRDNDHLEKINKLIITAKNNKNLSSRLDKPLETLDDLASIPLLRKSELIQKQSDFPPFAQLNVSEIKDFAHIYDLQVQYVI